MNRLIPALALLGVTTLCGCAPAQQHPARSLPVPPVPAQSLPARQRPAQGEPACVLVVTTRSAQATLTRSYPARCPKPAPADADQPLQASRPELRCGASCTRQ